MKKILIIIFMTLSLVLSAKDINVGDTITLQITGVSKDKIIDSFKNTEFSIENIKDGKDGTIILSIRGFKTGKNIINIGNKEINIDIKSLLTPEDKEIFINLSDENNKNLFLHQFPYVTLISSITGIGALLIILFSLKIKKDKTILLNPEEKFENEMNALSDDKWFYEMSYALREYIDKKYGSHFINGIYSPIKNLNDEDIRFIEWLDNYKFSKNRVDYFQQSKEKAFEIYGKLKEVKE
ncbi:hypothetical protein [Fusobacterium sp.]|uniref:hypothetical protein n=1 Tax=Fusobacterium sp. TaxID=68766 RepID=UPI00290372EE|nr:hypothetical protein [Fusobacterium sp.]MDU1912197.1 hypothetical protein [Fusobacterium sp.]